MFDSEMDGRASSGKWRCCWPLINSGNFSSRYNTVHVPAEHSVLSGKKRHVIAKSGCVMLRISRTRVTLHKSTNGYGSNSFIKFSFSGDPLGRKSEYTLTTHPVFKI